MFKPRFAREERALDGLRTVENAPQTIENKEAA
jgi:hypothetical protein